MSFVFPASSRWPFLAAVAIIAAALSDLVVEAVANAGTFGQAYFDTDDSSIGPALCAAVALAVAVIAGHMRAAFGSSVRGRRDRLATVARDLAARSPLRDAHAVFGLQLGAVWAMESVERFTSRGDVAAGLWWMGGPLGPSLAIHIGVGWACMLVAGRLMRVSVPRFAALVCIALARILAARERNGPAVLVVRRDAPCRNAARAAGVRQISSRAPPGRLVSA